MGYFFENSDGTLKTMLCLFVLSLPERCNWGSQGSRGGSSFIGERTEVGFGGSGDPVCCYSIT